MNTANSGRTVMGVDKSSSFACDRRTAMLRASRVGLMILGLAAGAAYGSDEELATITWLSTEAAPAATDSGGPVLWPGRALSDESLAGYRGGAELQINDTEITGKVADNAAHHLKTGSNFITTGAFGNTSGVPITVQNTGNNVLIQNSTTINLTIQ